MGSGRRWLDSANFGRSGVSSGKAGFGAAQISGTVDFGLAAEKRRPGAMTNGLKRASGGMRRQWPRWEGARRRRRANRTEKRGPGEGSSAGPGGLRAGEKLRGGSFL